MQDKENEFFHQFAGACAGVVESFALGVDFADFGYDFHGFSAGIVLQTEGIVACAPGCVHV